MNQRIKKKHHKRKFYELLATHIMYHIIRYHIIHGDMEFIKAHSKNHISYSYLKELYRTGIKSMKYDKLKKVVQKNTYIITFELLSQAADLNVNIYYSELSKYNREILEYKKIATNLKELTDNFISSLDIPKEYIFNNNSKRNKETELKDRRKEIRYALLHID